MPRKPRCQQPAASDLPPSPATDASTAHTPAPEPAPASALVRSSKKARARKGSSAVPAAAGPLLALLTDCETAAARISGSVPALASLTADLVARNHESIKVASTQLNSSRFVLLARKARVTGCSKRLSRKQDKRISADDDAAEVSIEQLHVWAACIHLGPDLNTMLFAASLLLASPNAFVPSPAIGVGAISALPFGCELGGVVTGDGLRVVSAAGPGLKWFEPHSCNEFSVVLAQADSSVPAWLSAGDVAVDILETVVSDSTSAAGSTAYDVRLTSVSANLGAVTVVYDIVVVIESATSIYLQLLVCGVAVPAASGDCNWGVAVPRRPLAGHKCAALGTHARTLAVGKGDKYGMAVSADEQWLVVGLSDEGMLAVYSLPGGELVRKFGGAGRGPMQFNGLFRLCFAPNGHLMVVDYYNKRLQEVTLEGAFVRSVGVRAFGDAFPSCVDVHDDVIAVGCYGGTDPHVVLFDFGSGAVMSRFSELGIVHPGPGQWSLCCTGIRFTLDGCHVVVADTRCLFVFTAAGLFVRSVGIGVLGEGWNDVVQSATGEYVVADNRNHRVCVFSPVGLELVRSWGGRGTGDGQFLEPTALAATGPRLYVMDYRCTSFKGRIQVFV